MHEEVTATSSPGYQLPIRRLRAASVSAFDPDRDMAQPHRTRRLAGLRVPKSGRDTTITVRDFPGVIIYVPPNTSTGYSIVPDLSNGSDPWNEYIAELEEKESDAQQVFQAYKARIDTLRIAAELEGIEMNEASMSDFWSFIRSSQFSRQVGLALMENGNLRAVWKGEDSSHLGLHFLGSRQVQYVIFKRRPGSRRISRTAGIDTFEGVKKQIGAFDLMPLVKA